MGNHAVTRGVGCPVVRLLSLTVRVAVLPAVFGCASSPPGLERHPLDDPSGPQAVAIIASSEAPKINLVAFARGYSEGAAKAGAVGVGAGALGALTAFQLAPLALLAGPVGIVAIPAIIVGGAAIGFVAGAAAGAAATVPEEQALAIERMATSAVSELELPNLAAAAVATGVTRLAARDASVMDRGSVSGPDGYRALRDRGFAAVIELRITEIGYSGSGADTIMALFMTAEARLVDTASGQPSAMRGLVYVSPQHKLGMWAQDGASLTMMEIERAYRTLGERIVEDFLLRATEGAQRSDAAANFFSYPNVPAEACGLVPRSPKLEWAGAFVGPSHLAESRVESVTPMLSWQGTPAVNFGSAKAPWIGAKGEDITYDLRIWSVVDDAPGTLVYERERLSRPQHQVEAALEPGSPYFWSVRMRYHANGHAGVTRWSAANSPVYFLRAPLKDALFYSRADDNTLKPIACLLSDLTPCRCLDFIPAANYYRFRTP